jgi:hypothetical protein
VFISSLILVSNNSSNSLGHTPGSASYKFLKTCEAICSIARVDYCQDPLWSRSFLILFFLALHTACLWKYFVLRSPSFSQAILNRCNHIISSRYNSSSIRSVTTLTSLGLAAGSAFKASNLIRNASSSTVTRPKFSLLHALSAVCTHFRAAATPPKP